MTFSGNGKYLVTAFFAAAAIVFAAAMPSHASTVTVTAEKNSNLGIIKGVVRDQSGSPIADATVAIFRLGTSKLLKQVSSANDGRFLARIIPGTYTVLAVAQGFNPVTLSDVSVNRSTELVYGFRLERSGSGNTLPEKRIDRNSSKWRIRAAQMQRAIYQNREGNKPAEETTANVTVDESLPVDEAPNSTDRRTQAVIETYFAGTRNSNYAGVNFAAMTPAGDHAEFVFSGQVGKGTNAPQRFGVDAKFRPNSEHQIRVSTSFAKIGNINIAGEDKQLGQMSFQALDEWKIREGVILVYGLDYSRFLGAGSDSSISPRLGLQYDIDSKTRFQTAFTTQTDERSWSQAVNFEGAEVLFREPVSVQDIFVSNNKPKLNRSQRLEFGIERILDNRSSVEANVFFDTAIGRGVGLTAMPIDALDEAEFTDITAQQQGNARGIRVVYNRRFSSVFSAAAGYSFGNGQRLSANAITNPSEAFDEAIFQSFFGQFSADLRTGTSVKTIYRLSPQATVFAIDPFKGRLAIYDPGLSVLVTQNLPTLGLPFRAEAVVDARNMFGFQTGVSGEEGSLRLNGQRRSLRGGILVRF
ncbi:MAG: TonB-dependent receptor [Acidobacteria bacterium]|nr:TonB-dependent receptor [Acidobacteriota bacterium]